MPAAPAHLLFVAHQCKEANRETDHGHNDTSNTILKEEQRI